MPHSLAHILLEASHHGDYNTGASCMGVSYATTSSVTTINEQLVCVCQLDDIE